MAKLKMTSTVVSQEMIATDIYSLWLRAEEIAVQAKPDNSFQCIARTLEKFFQDQSVFVKLIRKKECFALCIELQEKVQRNFLLL